MNPDPVPVNAGGLTALVAVALACAGAAVAASRGAPLPGGWRRSRGEDAGPTSGARTTGEAGVRRFLTLFLTGLALFLLLTPWVIQTCPWRTAAGFLVIGGGAALAAAGLAVNRYAPPDDALTDRADAEDNRNP